MIGTHPEKGVGNERSSVICRWAVSIRVLVSLLSGVLALSHLPAFAAEGSSEPVRDGARGGSGGATGQSRVEIFGGLAYDSNIIHLSDADVDEFAAGLEWDRYHVSTYDDLVVTLGMRWSYRRRLVGGRMSRVGFRYRQHHHSNNPIKDRENVLVWGEQEVSRGHYMRLGYYFVPHFYIRHLPDVDIPSGGDVSRYRAFDYSNNYFYAEWRFDPRWQVGGKATLGRRYEDYNGSFEEYDTSVWVYDIDASLDATRWLTAECGYRFEEAEAQGYDAAGETRATSDDVDASYERDSYWGGLSIDLRRAARLPLEASCRLEYRKKRFTTGKGPEEDSFHAERIDRDRRLDLELTWHLGRDLDLSGRYGYASREVDAPRKDLIAEVKDYTQGVFELGFTYVLVR